MQVKKRIWDILNIMVQLYTQGSKKANKKREEKGPKYVAIQSLKCW